MVPRSLARQLLGTFVAVTAGWLAPFVVIASRMLIESLQQRHGFDLTLFIGTFIATSWLMSWFIIPTWLLALIPLYLFVPRSSVFWRWPVCTLCGAAAGMLMMLGLFRGVPGVGNLSSGAWGFFGIAALVGGVTCLTAALTRDHFKSAI